MSHSSRAAVYLSLWLLPTLVLRAAAAESDPFAGVSESTAPETGHSASWSKSLFDENFGFRKEIMSQFNGGAHEAASSRQSLGFEMLKKFSSETATLASVDFQGRVVRRDRFVPVLNDQDGMRRPGWSFEVHNLYADFYSIAGDVGRLNARMGHFYVPFGLNLQTDTHGTILQLSNERNFGFERDWYGGVWGALGDSFNYDAYYLVGSGYDLKYRGQGGLGAGRLSLANRFSSEYGVEGGLSVLGGERLAESGARTGTQRVGLDGRYRQPVPTGLLTWSSEVSGGRDIPDAVVMQLYQAEYLHSSRRWGLASQYRRHWQEHMGSDGSLIGEVSWYFRNDVGNSNLHWMKLNVERQLERGQGRNDTIVALQYYRYW